VSRCTNRPDGPRLSVDEILHYGHADIHPLVLRSVLLAQPGVLGYQVRQTPSGAAVQVLLEREADLTLLREQLRTALARAGLADPDVQSRPWPHFPGTPKPASSGA
jgi:phenylacetate-CoA ligase